MGDEMTAGFCLAAGIIWRLIGFRLVDQDEAAGGACTKWAVGMATLFWAL